MKKNLLTTIILAAGQGTRMKSSLPKVLHPVAGKPMLQRAIETAKRAGANEVRVVVGSGENLVRPLVKNLGAIAFKQVEQLGTGDAVKAAEPQNLEGWVLILNGDHPLIDEEDLKYILEEFENGSSEAAVVTSVLESPGAFGRIIRQNNGLYSIVEAKDASAATLEIKEVNTGIYLFSAQILNKFLSQIENKNAQSEYYLTDLIGLCVENNISVDAIVMDNHVAFGVNNQKELAHAQKKLFLQKAELLMEQGVIMIDPDSTYIEDDVEIGSATTIYPNVHLKGKVKIGEFSVLEPNTFIKDSVIGNGVVVKAGSYIEGTEIKDDVGVGPYARLRPETLLEEGSRIGNFVELKKVKFGKGAKAGHLTYLGDASIGENTNIGCGTITCNFSPDKKKYQTTIGKDVFVGSDSQFVAPIEIGDGSVIGSGSTITKNVPENALAVSRGLQKNIPGYADRLKVKVKDSE